MMRRAIGLVLYWLGCGLVALCCVVRSDAQTPPSEFRPLRPEIEQFISYMVRTHGFAAPQLRALFTQTQPNPGVVRAISAPATSKPWYEFKPLFVDGSRISGGVAFWNDNAAVLSRAANEFGVPEDIIVALIGIETRYGKRTGSYRVMDALTTLAFDWPARGEYFRSELEEFLLLAREQRWNPMSVRGSFAGAMGLPQFMPGSYRRYAVDYDGDGQIDLWASSADVIGSVAGYLRYSGWKAGQPVAAPARIDGVDPRPLLELGLRPSLNVGEWRGRGATSLRPVNPDLAACLFSLDLLDGPEFWFGFDNFYALLQYNRSRNYAMAILELAREITTERERLAAGVAPEQ
ncbi:MAG TPA: lytic murein transglycosylase B [Burkholderiales bacterium]|nr:lytic murein transglycosylase B [Burkholderiales bacterium]